MFHSTKNRTVLFGYLFAIFLLSSKSLWQINEEVVGHIVNDVKMTSSRASNYVCDNPVMMLVFQHFSGDGIS
jgi:hypothetical protein